MPPKKKARKLTDKDFRQMLLDRIESADKEPIGTLYNEPMGFAENTSGGSTQIRVEMSIRTAAIRGALVSFYNGRGRLVSCYIAKDGDGEDFPAAVGKAAKFGVETAMTLPADELTAEKIGIEGVEWYEDDPERAKEAGKLSSKGSMKHVSCSATKNGGSYKYFLTPWSGITNDSWATVPEENQRVEIDGDDELQLGKTILQRAVFALSREEAKLHPDGKYHGERRKWADV